MKYKLLGLMLLLCLVNVLPQTASADNKSPNFKLSLNKSNPVSGDKIQVTLSGKGLEDVFAYEAILEFDSRQLTYDSWMASEKGYSVAPVFTGNQLLFAYTKIGEVSGSSGNLDMGTITFKTNGVGPTDITLKSVKLVDSKLASFTVQTSDVQVSAMIKGQVKKVVSVNDISKPAENGKVNVFVSGDVNTIVLPVNSANLIGNNKLSIHTDKLTLDLPPKVLAQLMNSLSGDELQNSTIELYVSPMYDADAKQLLNKGQNSSAAQLRLSGQVFEFSLSVVKKDGTVLNLSNFDQPLTIHLKPSEGFDQKLTAIYYIADDGTLEYIGGKYVNGEIVVQIYHFSKYALLEFKKSFADVPSSHWAWASIEELTAKHIINGTSADTFEPDRSVTRAEFTAMLVRGLNLTQAGSQTFADVASSDWYAQPISIAVKAGIVTGKTADSFAPNAQITREEMVTMVMRAYAISNGAPADMTKASLFSDEADVDSWALPYVREAASLQLISGREESKFVPTGKSTRAEAATILMRILP